MGRVCVIGIDGGTFDVIMPLAEEGELPNIRGMIENGVHGDLQSTLPPVTGPAWASFSTGKQPGKHGFFEFIMPTKTLDKTSFLSGEAIHGETFYEILKNQGSKCIIINLPVSHPPRIEETLITSWDTKGSEYVFPSKLVQEIPELEEYRLVPDASLLTEGKIEEYIEDVREMEKTRFTCANRLFRRDWDFFFILFDGSDRIQHVKYGEMVRSIAFGKTKLGGHTGWLDYFKDVDGYIGWFLENCPNDTNFFLISDHGFHSYKGLFFLHNWLMKEGYLRKRFRYKEPQRKQNAIGFKSRINAIFKNNFALTLFSYMILRILPFRYTNLGKDWLETLSWHASNFFTTDISRTVATSISNRSFGIYINDNRRFKNGIVAPEDCVKIENEIISKLSRLTEPRSDKPLMKRVLRKEDAYTGEFTDRAPDIMFEPNNYWIIHYYEAIGLFMNKQHNHHSMKGLLVAYGSDIEERKEVSNAKIVDLAPTILHLLGMPIPTDMDGRFLAEVFRKDSDPLQREVSYKEPEKKEEMKVASSTKEAKSAEERLRALGYV